jgi:hypothetical protein
MTCDFLPLKEQFRRIAPLTLEQMTRTKIREKAESGLKDRELQKGLYLTSLQVLPRSKQGYKEHLLMFQSRPFTFPDMIVPGTLSPNA